MVHNRNNIESEIVLVLIRNKTHLRSIARILEQSHSTILRKINELMGENIVDYIEEGRNKVYFIKNNLKARNYVYSAEIYKLSKLLREYPELSHIFESVKKNLKKGLVILFGSYAKGISKKESDIDLYLETADNKIKYKIQHLNSKLSIKIGKFDTNSLLIKELIKNHVIIRGVEDFYEKNKFFE